MGSEGAKDDDITSQPYILFGSSFPKDKEYTQVRMCVHVCGKGGEGCMCRCVCSHDYKSYIASTSVSVHCFPTAGLPEHQPDQDLHGDWPYSDPAQPGEPL